MTRFASKTLLFVLTWGLFAPLSTTLAPVPPQACCLRKTTHCREHAQMNHMQVGQMDIGGADQANMGQMDMGPAARASAENTPTAAFRAPNCCQQGNCCRGLSRTVSALGSEVLYRRGIVVALPVSRQQDTPRSRVSTTSHEVRGPPSL